MEISKINTGSIFLKDKFLDNPGMKPDIKEILTGGYSVNSYIIKYNDRQIIIDAGFSPHAKHPLGKFLEKSFFNIETKNSEILDYIRDSHIFLSHLHSDHVGYVKAFSQCKSNTIISNKHEYDQSKKFFSFTKGYKKGLIRNVPFDFIDITTFNRDMYPFLYHDFYNDGSFIVLSTPGHSKGHVSFLLPYKNYKLLFTGDLLRGFHEFKYPVKYFNYSNDMLNDSLMILKDWIKVDDDLLLIFGHNEEQSKIIGDGNVLDKLDELLAYQDICKDTYMR